MQFCISSDYTAGSGLNQSQKVPFPPRSSGGIRGQQEISKGPASSPCAGRQSGNNKSIAGDMPRVKELKTELSSLPSEERDHRF
jgi:hypothetical protein